MALWFIHILYQEKIKIFIQKSFILSCLYTLHSQQSKWMQSSKLGMWQGYHLSAEGLRKGYLSFQNCLVYKRMRGWTSGRSLSVYNSVKYPPPRCVPFLTQASFPALADDMEEAIPCVTCNFFLSCHISISCNISTLVNLLARAHIISCSILIARVCLIFTGIFSFFPSFFFFFLCFSFCFCEDSAPPLQEILQWWKEQD